MIAVRVSPDHRSAIVASPRTSTISRGPTPRTTCSTIDASTTDVVQGEVYRWHQRREPFQPRTCTSEGRKDTSKPAPADAQAHKAPLNHESVDSAGRGGFDRQTAIRAPLQTIEKAGQTGDAATVELRILRNV
jgi:hypothetical protein